ncbi:MAG: phenylacetate--CoA ligase family protein [Candidatus Bathyarchaeales archaeon]
MASLYSSLARNFLLPIYDLARGTSRFAYARVLDKTQWLSQEEINKMQLMNLRALLKHAYNSVPYYRRAFRDRRLTPEDIKSIDDLIKLPVLTKSHVRRFFWDLVSKSFPRSKLVPYVSGGTGDQIKFFVTKEQQSWELAAELRAYCWAGYRFGDKCVVFWGSPIDLARYQSILKRFTSFLERIEVLDSYVLHGDVLEKYVSFMRVFKPDIIRGYASSVYMVAKYMLEKGFNNIHPKAVITSAESLLDVYTSTIKKAFGCEVFDYYGSREIGSIAAECEEHYGYHISAENVVLEFVKDGEHVASGEDGEILVTSLKNYGMPFIRYAIGDVGKPSNEICACGRGLPLMASIEGRVSQFLSVYDRKLERIIPVSTAAPGPFSMALMQVPIESYRIVQESLEKVTIKAVKGKGYSQKHTDFVIAYLRKFLGDSVTIEFEFVDYIPPLPSGKRSVFISKINPFEP